jgi:isoleucyl-tRNA synthetase
MAAQSIQDFENEVIEFWKKDKIFEKSVENRSEDNLYVFYDGPPFITGLPHYGHLLGSIAKDVIPRYWTMKGKRVERLWGWDAQGIAVENAVQKELGIKNRRDIESYGLEKFIKACYAYIEKTSAEWNWYVDKIGRWVDIKNAYKTTDQTYMESVIWAFSELYKKGLVYEDLYTSLYCPTCGTPVSNFEIAMDNSYREETDPAVTVKFRVVTPGKFKNAFVLAWTTTPWTLPSNRALVVDEKAEYVLVSSGEESFIVAGERLGAVFEGKEHKVVEEFLGKDLLSLEYEPLFKFFESKEGDYKIYSFEDMVNMEDGTGVVHSAPGFGEIDTKMGKHYGITINLTIDDEGKFLPGVLERNPYEGQFYLKTNDAIREDLTSRGLMFKDTKTTHRVPFHDRCNTLLVQKAQNSWFIKVSEIKDKLLENNKDINWVPAHLKEGRFAQGIEQAPEWCISRTRFWATPMPVWEAEDGDRIVISSIKELEELSEQEVKDLHRPYIDEVTIEKDGKVYKRRSEVLDSWMEAGSMPYAQIHYPFENKEKFEKNFPGDYIIEYMAQVRAWFYVMHVLSTALFGKKSFKNVITTGTLMGSDGRKMSKTFNNYPDPREVLESYGGDAFRLYMMSSPLMVGEDANFEENEIKTKLRNVINPLWNSTKFFVMYAKQHDWSPEKKVESQNILDKWILARLHQTIKIFASEVEAYQVPSASRVVEEFVDDLSRWYVRRSRDRISSGEGEALSTLYEVLMTFSKAVAPLIPFVTENIYKHLGGGLGGEVGSEKESVHLCDYPEINEKLVEDSAELLKNMTSDREVVSAILAIRAAENIPVRQMLGFAVTIVPVHYADIVKDETNVGELVAKDAKDTDGSKWVSNDEKNEEKKVWLNTEITPELKLDRTRRELIRKIQGLRKEAGLSVSDEVEVVYENTPENSEAVEKFGEEIKKKVLAKSLEPGTEFGVVKDS